MQQTALWEGEQTGQGRILLADSGTLPTAARVRRVAAARTAAVLRVETARAARGRVVARARGLARGRRVGVAISATTVRRVAVALGVRPAAGHSLGHLGKKGGEGRGGERE